MQSGVKSIEVGGRLLEALDVQYCVQLSALHICLADWSNDKITVEFLLYGVRIAKATLKANSPCIKVKEGNDLAKVKGCIKCLKCGFKFDCNGW